MTTQITFRDFKGFDHLREYVQATINQTVDKLNLSRSTDINIIIRTDHGRQADGRPPVFLCEATLKDKSQKIFVKKFDADFQTSVRKCMKAVTDILVKRSAARRHKTRRGLTNIAQMTYGLNYEPSTH